MLNLKEIYSENEIHQLFFKIILLQKETQLFFHVVNLDYYIYILQTNV